MEWDNLACGENDVQSSDPQAGILGVKEMPVFVVVRSLQ